MLMLRSLAYFLFLVLSILVFGLPLALLGWLLPSAPKQAYSNAWSAANLWALGAICGLRYRVDGKEHLPDQPSIIMSKHQSTWETIALRHILGGQQSWVLKRELMWVPVFGWALATMYPIAINRKAGRRAVKQVLDQGLAYLERGHHIIIFPEGTRTAPGQKGRYGVGGALLAERSGAPVVPVAHNAGEFWKRRDLRKYPGTVDVVIGAPVPTAGRKAQEIMRDVETWIEATVERLPSPTQDSA